MPKRTAVMATRKAKMANRLSTISPKLLFPICCFLNFLVHNLTFLIFVLATRQEYFVSEIFFKFSVVVQINEFGKKSKLMLEKIYGKIQLLYVFGKNSLYEI